MNPIYLIITQRTILILILLEYLNQGCNARKNFSEVYTSFVLQFTVSGRNVNTRQMSKPDMADPSFTYNNQWNILVIGNYYVNYQNNQNLMLLTSSDTERTPVQLHPILFTNSAQRELVSMFTQSIYARK